MLAEARELVSERLGLAFPSRRGDDLQQAFAARSVASLREQPTTGPEWRSLISELTVRESYFFRESGELERALSALIAERRDTRRLALWSAGCASGEEPYTLAMLLAALLPEPWDITIHATDIDTDALEAARRGIYSDWGLRETPAWARRMYFRPAGQRRFELSRQIREAVTFAPLNLATDGYPGSLDLIVCRNVLMYFTDAARERTVERLNASLAPGGRLVLSPLDAPPALGSPAPAPPAVREPEPPPFRPRPRASTRSSRPARRPTAGAWTPRGRCAWRRCASARWTPTRISCWPPSRRNGATSTPRSGRCGARSTPRPTGPAAHFRLGGLLLRTGAAEAGRRSFATAAALLADADPGTLVDGLTAGEVLAAARAAS